MKQNQKKRKSKSPPERSQSLKWKFGPNIPTSDFFEGQKPEDDFGEAVENFIFTMEQGEFLVWEAVMAQEQGLPLSRPRRAALTLENEEQRMYRINDFLEGLREHKDSVRYFDLTLASSLNRVIVPTKERPILIQELQDKLGMESTADRIADFL